MEGKRPRRHRGGTGACVPVCDYKSCPLVNGAIHHSLLRVWGGGWRAYNCICECVYIMRDYVTVFAIVREYIAEPCCSER